MVKIPVSKLVDFGSLYDLGRRMGIYNTHTVDLFYFYSRMSQNLEMSISLRQLQKEQKMYMCPL